MPFTDNHGVRLHWDERGAGTPILLVMGHRYSSAMWYPILPALSAAHRVVWFDNRGTGGSDSPRRFTVADLAGDALAVMDAAGLERAHVFGMSMGGVVVIELALQQPARVISLTVGCSGILTADKPRMPAFLRVLYRLPPWALRLLTPSRRPDRGYGSAAPAERIAFDEAMVAKDPFNVSGVIGQAAAVAGYSVTPEAVSKLAMPTLVLHGDEDSLVPYRWGVELDETLPNSRLVTLKGAGHNFLIARGEEAAKALLDFIGEVDAAGPA